MRLRYRHYALALVLIALPLLGAGCLGDQDEKPVLEDSFDGPRGEWGDDEQDEFSRGYASGKYFIALAKPSWFAWTSSRKKLADASLEVDAYLSSGSEDNHFGLFCRLDDAGNFYYLAVSSDGYYGIFLREDGDALLPLNAGVAMTFSPAIKVGSEVNHIRAICEGDQLSLYANGRLLETATDDTHRKGRFGMGAGSGPEAPTRIHFDDLVVYER